MEKYNLIVIGSGPAGRRAAIQAAKFGESVLVIEKGRRVGGVSVHTGTIPSKTLRETVLNLSGWRERGFYGRSYRVKQDLSADDLRTRLEMTLNHEVEVLEHQFARNQVTTLRGEARFTGPHQIEVTGEEGEILSFEGDRFLLAVGTIPFRPDTIPFDGKSVFDSDEVLELDRLPKNVCVIGAGVIGIEYATIFSALDLHVTLVEPRDSMLDFIDRELIEDFTHQLRDRGMVLRFGCKVEKVEVGDTGNCQVLMEDGRTIRSDIVLFAAGRMGATKALNLDACGLEVDHRGRLAVDPETFQTSVPHIYAAGDVIVHSFPTRRSSDLIKSVV